MEQGFNWGKLALGVLAGLAVVAVVAAVIVTGGAALGVAAAGLAVAKTAVAVGCVAVGMTALSDLAAGEVSDVETYMMAGLKGSITGAAFAMIGIAGQTVGTLINCSTKVGTLIKVGVTATSKVAGGISITMAGFDITAFVGGLFEPNNPITRLNQKLHSYDEYNYFQVGVTAAAIFTGGMTRTMVCFVAGTPILTPSGLVAIENIKTGDKVVSTNAETFEIAEKNVIETYIRQTKGLGHLIINGELIKTTLEHSFYVRNRGFVNAGELHIGDKLLDSTGNVLIVEETLFEIYITPVSVYNFEVEDFHTYHVGDICVLVHNADYRLPVPNPIKASNGLKYKSNPKHTRGAIGNRTNAGIEPKNSLDLFGKSVPTKNPNVRFTYDTSTKTFHRFSFDGTSEWHWSGATNQAVSLTTSEIPLEITKLYNVSRKGW